MEPEWDPHDPSFLAQEYALLKTGGLLRERPEEFRASFLAGMHSNPCKFLQECGDINLENVFNFSDYCFECWGTSLNPDATHITH